MTPVRSNVVVALCVLAGAVHAAEPAACGSPSPVGRWLVRDELGPRAVVEVRATDAQLVGVVREVVARPGEPREPRCDDCEGRERGQPIRGLEILHLAASPATGAWDGDVLDPEEGRRYRARASLAECGRVLELRGYVLLPVFGRVERWQRLD